LFLVLQVIKGKVERKVLNSLLHFNFLTLSNCAGIDLKTWIKEEKQRKSSKG